MNLMTFRLMNHLPTGTESLSVSIASGARQNFRIKRVQSASHSEVEEGNHVAERCGRSCSVAASHGNHAFYKANVFSDSSASEGFLSFSESCSLWCPFGRSQSTSGTRR